MYDEHQFRLSVIETLEHMVADMENSILPYRVATKKHLQRLRENVENPPTVPPSKGDL